MNRLPSLAAVLCVLLMPAHSLGQPAPSRPQQPDASSLPPTAVGGWRYQKGANDMHVFFCERPQCVPGSRVSYRLYAVGAPIKSVAQFRREQEQVAKMLEEKVPGTKVQILHVEGDNKTERPIFLKSIRLQSRGGGFQEYINSGLIMGAKLDASLISSSRDEAAAKSNYAQFMLALALLVQVAPQPKAPEKTP